MALLGVQDVPANIVLDYLKCVYHLENFDLVAVLIVLLYQ